MRSQGRRMFPAYAGMNLPECLCDEDIADVPRIRGDEPAGFFLDFSKPVCSPHTRG